MVKTLLEDLSKYENEMAQALMQVTKTKRKLLEEYNMLNMSNDEQIECVNIPFAAYEAQLERFQEEKKDIQDRNDAEKDRIHKHYQKIIKWICIPFATFVILVFGTVFWFFNNYDIATYTQDIEYGNANFIGNDGDISNGEANYSPWETEESENQGDVD